ncbi:MAG: hypothetical protein KGH93_00755 [Patescibacteria group bacterium]|nr:hypothetical protein [Patescibacteria group bacterium]MDE1945713.1 hypothetical protein [Patescibacteria group bacterium]
MIYFYHGADADSARKKANVTVDALLAKRPDAAYVKLGGDDIAAGKLAELAGGQGLFSAKSIVYLSGVFENKENKEVILKHIKELADSENIFIFAEGKTDKASLAKIEKVAEKTEEFSEKEKAPAKKSDRKPDFFAFADAFGRRDRKVLWMMLADAFASGMAAEEIHGMLFWEAKNLMLAARAKNAAEAGLNPYPFSKARENIKYFKNGELAAAFDRLVAMYHDAHRGLIDFPVALERFVLES